jgi:mRNA-degrading endonuclease RelE of RelBE toxin-antitoxin system
MFKIEFTAEALEDLKSFRKFEQKEIKEGVKRQLRYEAAVETRNRKRLKSGDTATWELRIGKFRVFYNVEVEASIVSIEAIGFKIGNTLFIRGEKREL